MPFELWNWAARINAPNAEMDVWKDIDFSKELAARVDLPVFLQNDATAACGAELVFGRGAELNDFIYFFVGTFIGGGVVLNQSVYSGRSGNAGALGSMPIVDSFGSLSQLTEHASIYRLEIMLIKNGIDPSPIWLSPSDWPEFDDVLGNWLEPTAYHIALAIVAASSVIDFEAAIIDGNVPISVRSSLVREIQQQLGRFDPQGIKQPEILEGSFGRSAKATGGAGLPLFDKFHLDQNVLFKELKQC